MSTYRYQGPGRQENVKKHAVSPRGRSQRFTRIPAQKIQFKRVGAGRQRGVKDHKKNPPNESKKSAAVTTIREGRIPAKTRLLVISEPRKIRDKSVKGAGSPKNVQ